MADIQTNLLDAYLSDFGDVAWEIVLSLKKRNIMVDEDFCKELTKPLLKLYKIGFDEGLKKGANEYEKRIAERLAENLINKNKKTL